MRRLFLAVLLVMLAAPAGAVQTSSLQLTTTWQSLGSGPLQVQTNNQSQTLYQISDSAPAAGSGGFFLQGNGQPLVVPTTSQVWVRARSATSGPAPVALYAPVAVATANGSGGGSGGGSVPLATGTGGSSALTLGTSPTTSAIPANSARKSLLIINQSTSASVTFCFASSNITPATGVAGCYTLYAGGTLAYPASGYVPQDAFNAVASAANTPVTVEAH